MKYALIALMMLLCTNASFAQSDTIYAGDQKGPCTIVEVTSDSIKLTSSSELVPYNISKSVIKKIVFKSGQVQTFDETIIYKNVIGVDDWEGVSIARSAREVRPFRQVGNVSADVQSYASTRPGPALMSAIVHSTGMTKKRFYRKLKMQCAMLGGNVVHVTQADSTSAQYLVLAARGAEMSGVGVAYSTSPIDATAFRTKLNGRTTFTCVEQRAIAPKDFNFSATRFDSIFKLNYVISESGLTYAVGTLNNVSSSQFRVTNFTDKYFILMHKVKSTIYNYIINF